MRRIISYIAAALLLFSCVNELEQESSTQEGQEVDFVLPFGAPPQDEFEIGAKSTLPLEKETKVWNLYIFIFDGSGTKVYSHFFDESNLDAEAGSDWWTVNNSENTTGTVHIHTVSKDGCLVYGVANIDADMVNISPELLATVQRKTDLDALVATLNQNITSRNGYFPMTGTIINTDPNASNYNQQQRINPGSVQPSNYILRLCRLDAKIIFKIRVASPNEDSQGNVMTSSNYRSLHPDCANLNEAKEKYGCKIGSFTPGKWQVVNVPKKSYVIENGSYAQFLQDGEQDKLKNASSLASDFFNSVPTNFDAAIRQDSHPTYSGSSQSEIFIHPFSFYMMENRRGPKSTPSGGWTYAAREKQTKTEQGTGSGVYENGDFVYAPDLGTYVVFSGRIIKDNITYGTAVGATLNAEPTYVVHLGDFASQLEDFNVFRNHTYTYNITIFDVDDIRTEVEINYNNALTQQQKLAENEPGASGTVTVSLEEIFTSDCHYSSHVITFHAANIKEDNVTWYVKTPFNPDGKKPLRIPDENGVEHDVTSGLDYEWVEFRVNERHMDNSTDPPTFQYWEDERQIYKPRTGEYSDGKTMNVSELVEYLKRQKQRYRLTIENDFDNGMMKDKEHPGQFIPDPNGAKIAVTAFVNEYYYEKDPRDGSYSRDLWKKAINQPMREMHILSDTKMSADQKSHEIGASFTIQQLSIQSVYNMDHPDLQSAWGSEHFDDPLESDATKSGVTWYSKGNVINAGQKRGNDSMTNGRKNTAIEWGLLGQYKDDDFGSAEWATYLQLNADNETPLMKAPYNVLRYSCMSRNRDNNGNGKIDEDELRWYMGATNQLYGLYLGDYGIEGTAKLYQRNAAEQAADHPTWNQHVLSSTMNYESNSSDGIPVAGTQKKDYNGPRCIWAEEGVTGSDMNRSAAYNEQVKIFSTRCLRNLGYDENSSNTPESRKDFTYSPIDNEPVNYIQVKRKKKELNGSTFVDYPVPESGDGNAYTSDTYYEFDITYLNKASRRYYTSMELDCTDEFAEAAMFPDYLRMAALGDTPTAPSDLYVDVINEFLDDHVGQNPYCPPGFRLPNVRELVLIRYFLPERKNIVEGTIWIDTGNSKVNAVARNYWSFGIKGSNKRGNKDKGVWGWAANKDKIMVAHDNTRNSQKVKQLRCVKDINPNDPNDIY